MAEFLMKPVTITERVNVSCPIHTTMDSFARILAAQHDPIVDYFPGVLVRPYIDNTVHFWTPASREIIELTRVPRLNYATVSDYREYLVIDADKKTHYTKVAPTGGQVYAVDVVDRSHSELGEVDKRIVEAIEKAEKSRKN